MEKTKANFRALRESLGYTQLELAEKFGVSAYSVKRWERPDRTRNNPPDSAWNFLVAEYSKLCELTCDSVDALLEVLEEKSDAGEEVEEVVTLTYYRTQEDLDRFSNVPGYVSQDYLFVNRVTQAVALMLYDLDIPYEFVYKSEPTEHIVINDDGEEETYIV